MTNGFMAAERRTPRIDLMVVWLVVAPALAAAVCLNWAGSTRPAVVTAAVAVIIAVIIAPEVGLYIYFGWQALDAMFLTEGQTILTPGKWLALLLLTVYILRPGRVRARILVSKRFVWAGLILGVYGLLTATFAIDPKLALRFGGQIVVQAILVAVAIHTLAGRAHVRTALFFTVCGGLIAAVVLFLGGTSDQFRRATLGRFANPNTTALGLSVALACVPAAWVYARHKWLRFLYMLAVPLMLAAILKTGSRAALFAIMGSIALPLVLTKGASYWRRIAFAGFGLAIAFASLAVVLKSELIPPKSQERVLQLIEGRAGLGEESRFFIWRAVLRAYAEQPWGFAYGNTALTVSKHEGVYIDAHSSYLSILVEGGPLALGLLLFCLWQLVRRTRQIPRSGPGVSAAILASFVMLSGVAHTVHFAKWFWIPATLCLLLCEQGEREKPVAEHCGLTDAGGHAPPPAG